MEQKRLLLAFALSAVILLGWSYLFPPPLPQQDANTPQQANNATPSPAPSADANAAAAPNAPAATTPDTTPQKSIVISTPLYDVELDSRGAVAKSWIIKRNKDEKGESKPLYSISGTRDNPQPLQLVSPEGLKANKAPLQIRTGRDDLDSTLNSRNFQFGGIEGDAARIELRPGERKTVELSFSDPAGGVEAQKRLTFSADDYTVRLEAKVTQNGQPIQNAKIAVGPSIGDQGVPQYTFYSVPPEGVAAIGDSVQRLYASNVHASKESPQVITPPGPVRWAAVGDTYFAMTLVLPRPAEGLEYRTEKYEHEHEGTKEDRYLITGYVPLPADGAPMYLYTGPKDHDQLEATGARISRELSGAPVDLSQLIDYGWTRPITKPIATPILWSIQHLNRLTGSYGVAIILFTIIIYSLFFPLKWRSSKSMKKAQKLAPQMKELQEKIKGLKANDPRLKELQMEQLRLMKEGNPLGGCLPLLIQMPFLLALYVAITISIDFRQSSFLWIQDLSAGDPTHILPILMAGSMLVLQLITPAPSADPLQRKMMAIIMPLMMLYILWSAPAGLLVYWLVGNLVGFGQQVVINRMLKSEDDPEPPTQEKGKAGSRPKKSLSETRHAQA
jgi:YidC/Oxa1 family membrane protein insertase